MLQEEFEPQALRSFAHLLQPVTSKVSDSFSSSILGHECSVPEMREHARKDESIAIHQSLMKSLGGTKMVQITNTTHNKRCRFRDKVRLHIASLEFISVRDRLQLLLTSYRNTTLNFI